MARPVFNRVISITYVTINMELYKISGIWNFAILARTDS